MKKIVSLLLTLALVLGTITTALAVPADVIGTEYEDVATKLGALGLMIGDEGGFRPNDSITRAEFATVVVRALGLEAAAKFSTSPTKFTDVTEAHQWAWGYINVATEQGVIIGYGDGKFGPMDPVTYEQAITMLVRALGYEPAVVGGYPAGYLAKAAELDITDGVKVVAGAGAPRGAVAQMLDNSLEVKLMERVTFGDEKKFEAVDKTILEDKLGVEIVEGEVKKVDLDDNKIKIDSTEYKAAEGVLVQGLEGVDVIAWKFNKEIVYIELDSSVIFDYIEAVDTTNKTVDLKLADDTFEYDDSVAPEVGYAKIIMDDDVVVAVEKYDITLRGFVDEVNEDSEYLDYINPNGDVRKVRYDKDDVIVIIDHELAEVGDIKEGALLFASADAKVLVVSTETVEGTFERSRSNEVNIGGDYYDAVALGSRYYSTNGGEKYALGDANKLNDLLGEEVVAYVDYKGDVLFIAGEVEESTSKVIVLAYTDATDVGFDKQFKALTSDGEKVTYTIDPSKTVTVEEKKVYELELNEDGEVVAAVEKVDLADPAADVASVDEDKDILKAGATYYITDKTVFFNVEDYLATGGKIDDVEIVDWADIEGAEDVTGLDVIVFADEKSNAGVVVIKAGLDSIGANDLYVAYVLDDPATVSKDEVELKLDNGTEVVYVVFDKDDVVGVAKEDVIT